MHYTVVFSSVIPKDALPSDDQQFAAGMQIVFGVNTEVSEVIFDVVHHHHHVPEGLGVFPVP